ncbi:DNA-formamidopyrimidine glycosylase family protein [Solilutibacter silvestris]|uniref:DNA-formamidopyrimidine glycosylase family protein n=1 Tax=Solilutibacter silvestris TaxID=1645665 RepID=UPI003D33F0BD
MPEGPSIVLLREAAQQYVGRRVLEVEGNSKQPIVRLRNRVLKEVRSWGKHFLLDFGTFWVRIHFGLFGSWRINEASERAPRLRLQFSRGDFLAFYACSVQIFEGSVEAHYDWSADVMNPHWDAKAARAKLRRQPEVLVADALLDQAVFSGVGNIIKNEVLHRIRVHPESRVGALPPRKLAEMVEQARVYSFDFLDWKRDHVLRQHWQVHAKTVCPRDGTRLTYRKHLGKRQRRAFWCDTCQRLYG